MDSKQTPKPILLVDRKPERRQADSLLIQRLRRTAVREATHGTEAWSIIKNEGVELIISDWQLHREMSGLVLLKILRADEQVAGIPFILISEELTRDQVMMAGMAGVTEIIVRPFSDDVLKRKLQSATSGAYALVGEEPRRHFERGVDLMRRGRYEEAALSFERVLSITENAEVYYNLGYIRTAQKRYDEAIWAFRKATELDRFFADAYAKLADMYAMLDRLDQAQENYRQAADIYLEKKQDNRAEKAFLKILKINPDTPNVYNSLGIAFRRQGKYDESVRMYRKALKVNPFDENIHYNLARVLMMAEKPAEARKVLEKALNINGEFHLARQMLELIPEA